MEALTCRLIPYAEADGAANMAADEVLVRSALETGPALRLYGWSPATLSLGYFQPAALRLTDARWSVLPWVRRPSGGATLVHHHELTYALALPPGRNVAWIPRMHAIIARVLADLGAAVEPVTNATTARHGDVLCFQQHTPGDLVCRGHKVVGSAQRKVRQALLQHGSILLRRSEHTPALPGLAELAGVENDVGVVSAALLRSIADDTGWRLKATDWSQEEEAAIAALASEQYRTPGWNEKR